MAITDTRFILAYVGVGEEYYAEANEIISEETKQTLKSGRSPSAMTIPST